MTYTGKEVLCAKCVQIPVRETQSLQSSPTSTTGTGNVHRAGFKKIRDGFF